MRAGLLTPWSSRLLATTALTSTATLLALHASTGAARAQTVVIGPGTPAPYTLDRSGSAGATGQTGSQGTCDLILPCSTGGQGGAGVSPGPTTVEVASGASLKATGSATSLSLTSNGGQGGTGGAPADFTTPPGFGNGGPGGGAGLGGTVDLQFDANSTVASPAGGGAAVVVNSNGGRGADGGRPLNRGAGGQPAGGNNGGTIRLGLAPGALVTSTAPSAAAIGLAAIGGNGGFQAGGSSTSTDSAIGKNGGDGGAGGTIQTASSGIAGAIASNGSGVAALSRGGNGNDGGQATGSASTTSGDRGGNGGAGGIGGTVTLLLAGPSGSVQAAGPAGATGAQIQVDGPGNSTLTATTAPPTAGLLAQSFGGAGGFGGSADGNFGPGFGGDGGRAGGGGAVAVNTTGGTIATTGYGAAGVLALSAGGSGGSGGVAGSVGRARGGNGAPGGDGGPVTLDLCPTGACQAASGPAVISTAGEDADAVVALSVGGGGGYGGDVTVGGVGASIAIGGVGAQGGSGGGTTIRNGFYAPPGTGALNNGHVVTTGGEYARGLVAQSVGGGGGRGGDAIATDFGALSVSIGGASGNGGDGGTVVATNGGIVQTAGAHSTAIDSQSVGGGGGTGGAATSVTVGSQVTTAAAVGGAGGTGGNGGNAYAANFGQVGTLGDSAPGVSAQSVGGGGGHGGASVAKTFQVYNSKQAPSINLNVSLGGTGGNGGIGGQAHADNTGVVFTGGRGSHALVAQSVGGGGGDGGAATAYSQQFRASTTSVTTTIGGKGGTGGAGGPVQMRNGGLVFTLGKGSDGVLAHSVGGGGGAGGYGESDTGNFRSSDIRGSGLSLQATVTLGGSGGSGNVGGPVTVNNYLQPDGQGTTYPGAILTRGDNSVGIFAQSVGGGGGVGANSTAQGSGGAINVNVAVGGSGGSGNHGGAVSVDNGAGAVLTAGASAHGIFAQSVGGGGGRGGDAATGAGTDPEIAAYNFIATGAGIGQGNQVIGNIYDLKDNSPTNVDASGKLFKLLTTYEDQNNAADPPPAPEQKTFASYISADVGAAASGRGGSGGDGGAVTVSSAGSVDTRGPRSLGVFAQSVGGSGGDGGTSHASTSNDIIAGSTINGAVSVGGGGGSSGNGGNVTVANTGSITTLGDLSHAVFAQSVGGGGGTGGLTIATASAVKSFAVGIGGNGGASGNGGAVSVESDGGAPIKTSGTGAVGIAAQSVGGGGGLATLMSSDAPAGGGRAQSRSGPFNIPNTSLLPFFLGGRGGASGGGGTVVVTMNGLGVGDNDPRPYVVTSGTDAYGVLAQSVGGGGGWYSGSVPSNTSLATLLPSSSGASSGNGGAVAVTLGNQAYIYTSGAGAVGVLAQSVGGGGGLVGGMSQVRADQAFQGTPNTQRGQGGNVTVTFQSGGNVVATGARAHGVFAQSVGGGGGVLSRPDGTGYAFSAAGPYTGCSGDGCTGAVTVNLTSPGATVRAQGEEAYAVFAQSRGNGVNTTTINNQGYIQGLDAAAGAVHLDGAAANTINNSGIIIAQSADSVAIAASAAAGYTTVNNSGTITGQHSFPNGGTINNQPGGTLNTGAQVNLGAGGVLNNQGTVSVGGAGRLASTAVAADFVQGASGRLVVDADHAAGRADQLIVQGRATLAGAVEVRPTTVANRPVTVLTATDGVNFGAGVSSTRTHLFSFDAQQSGNTVRIQPRADFVAPAAALGANQRSVAGHLQGLWNSGASGMDAGFTSLARIADGTAYADGLNSLSGQTVGAVAAFRYGSSLGFVDNMYGGCPTFAQAGLSPEESSCVFSRILGSTTRQDNTDGALGYRANAQTFQFGGQREVAPGWFLGGSLGYENSQFYGARDTSKVFGDSALAGITLRRQTGRWLFSGALDAGYGWYDSKRPVVVGGTTAGLAKASPTAWHLGVHGRAAYQIPLGGWYVQPYADLAVLYVRGNGYTESGAAPFNLAVDGKGSAIVAAAAAVEVGGRVPLGVGAVLRPFASVGVGFLGNDGWSTTARFAGQPSSTRGFRASTPLPDVLAKLSVGAEILSSANWDLRLQYDANLGDRFVAQAGVARLAHRF